MYFFHHFVCFVHEGPFYYNGVAMYFFWEDSWRKRLPITAKHRNSLQHLQCVAYSHTEWEIPLLRCGCCCCWRDLSSNLQGSFAKEPYNFRMCVYVTWLCTYIYFLCFVHKVVEFYCFGVAIVLSWNIQIVTDILKYNLTKKKGSESPLPIHFVGWYS